MLCTILSCCFFQVFNELPVCFACFGCVLYSCCIAVWGAGLSLSFCTMSFLIRQMLKMRFLAKNCAFEDFFFSSCKSM